MFRYVDQHFYTPETFLENTASLADNAEIRERLFDGFRGEIILLADGEPADEEEDTGFSSLLDDDEATVDGSDPIPEERIARDQAIEEILLDVFESDLYDESFTLALTSTQQQIVRTAELESAELLRDKGEITFDMRRLYPMIYQRLAADPRTAEITQNEVPASYGIFPVADRETTLNAAWSIVRNGPAWRTTTLALAVVSLIGAVVIAERRPSTAIQFGGGMVGVGVVVVVLVYLIRFVVPLLAGGGSSAGPVVATYVENVSPLVSAMVRLIVLGAILAVVGFIARMIWPDDWVYSSVSDDRGVRSIMRRKGSPAPEETQQQPAAAAVPVGYPAYGAQPYPGYPPQWYPGQPYPPGYAAPYPTGPYAQPAQPLPQHYASPGKPTVPVMPVGADGVEVAGELVPPAAPPLDGLPADAAQAVPRVVAAIDDDSSSTPDTENGADDTSEDTVATPVVPEAGGAKATVVETSPSDTTEEAADEWASEPDW